MYLTLEGSDGVGKTTQALALVNTLEKMGHSVLHVKQPGTSAVAKRLRELLLDPDLAFEARTELMLFASAWLDVHTNIVIPALRAGFVVVSERGLASNYSYQHVALTNGMGEWGLLMMYLKQLLTREESELLDKNSHCVVLKCSVETAMARVRDRGDNLDRLEQMGGEFYKKVLHGFDLVQSTHFPYRTTLSKIDVDGLDVTEVHVKILAAFGIIDQELEHGEPIPA